MTVATSVPRVTSPRATPVDLPSDELAERVIFRRRSPVHRKGGDTLGELLGDAYGVDLGPNAGAQLAEEALDELADLCELIVGATNAEVTIDPDLVPRVVDRMRLRARLCAQLAERMRMAWQWKAKAGLTSDEVQLEGETDAA